MPYFVHMASVPIFRQSLAVLSAVLDKAEEHCKNDDIDPTELLRTRLAPDMYTLTEQFSGQNFMPASARPSWDSSRHHHSTTTRRTSTTSEVESQTLSIM